MPGSSPHRFEFAGRPPIIFILLAVLFFAAIFLTLLSNFDDLVRREPFVRWFAVWGGWVVAGLGAAIGIMLIIFRKQIRYTYRGKPQV